jgi:CHAT domain-containing protein/Tfp pilus assembly protein PilF
MDKVPASSLPVRVLVSVAFTSRLKMLYQQALAIRKEVLGEKHPSTATSLNNLAGLYESQGNYSAAEPLYQQALAIVKEVLGEKHPDTAASLNNLAGLYESQGNYSAAEPLYQQALAIRKEVLGEKHPDTAQSLNNLAVLYFSQGNYSAAGPLYQQALAIRKEVLGEEHPDTAQSLNNLAELYRTQGNYSTAETLYQQALAIHKEVLGEKHPYTATSLNNLAELYRTQGNYSAAEPLLKQALAIRKEVLGTKHPYTAQSLNNLGVLYYFRGNYSAAETLYQQVLVIYKEVLGEKHPDIATFLNNLAGLQWAMGDLSQTLALLKQGTDIQEINLAIFLNQIGDESRKQAYVKTLTRTTDATIFLHLNSAADNPQAADLALTTILRRKGRVLDALSNTVALLRQRLNPSIQATFDDLGARRSRLASLSFQGPGKLPPEVFKQELATLNQQIQQLESQLSSQSAEFRAENQPITVGAVQNLLPKDGALVEYIVYTPYNPKTQKWGKPRYAAYILLPNGNIKGIDLGDAAEIDKLIAAWLQTLNTPPGKILPFQKRAEKEQKAAGAELTAKIFAPLRPYLKNAQHLLIAPDSQLNLIPFAALPDGAEGKYLIQDYQLTFLTSGRDLLKLQNPAPSRSPSLVMGNPDYGASVLTQPGDAPRSADIGKLDAWCCSPLPGAQAEVEALRPLLPGANIYTGAEAGVDKLEPLQAPPILHLAAHGFFLPDNPPPADPKPGLTGNLQETPKPDLRDNPLLRSGLALTGFNPKQNKYGGALTALQATTLDLWGTKLVVLSACQTGVGDVRTGEGVYGLRRAFVLAGAESQVMSLWNVSDLGTESLMVKYYQKLQQGVGRSEALRQVQLEMLQGEEYPNPYYWAAFTPSGDWRPFTWD